MDKIETMQSKLDNKLNDSAKAAKEQHEQIQLEIRSDITKVTDRVDVLERWRWMIVGGAIVVGYLIGHLEFFAKLLN
jgi:hypothetical protein